MTDDINTNVANDNIDGSDQPAMIEFVERLRDEANRLDGLTLEIQKKLQTIKKYNKPKMDKDPDEPKSECLMDELNNVGKRFDDYNGRLNNIIRHLNSIV